MVMLLLALWFILYQATGERTDEVSGRATTGESGKESRETGEVAESQESTVREAAKEGRVRVNPWEVGANEAGSVMVLEYHRVGGDPGFAPDWTMSSEEFREQLEYLYTNDYYPINLRDLVENRIDVPAGKTPVVS